ncbi:MAG TPA: hypothetical protein VGR57_04585 [Ktedonobacterales bacterium]|nr:hypothetical protein [Ktedonobacterales bacterium]
MARALDGDGVRLAAPPAAAARATVWPARLALGLAALLGVVGFVFGTSWDIQWHTYVGRDRTLVPPHVLMLGAIALCGGAAAALVVIESLRARRDPALAAASTPFADLFHAPLGAYIAGFGALDAAAGFPLDVSWHALYGIDVSIWAPFHIMIISGMAFAALGVAAWLLSAAQHATRAGAAGAARAGELGALLAGAVAAGTLLLFLDAAFGRMEINLFGLPLNVFPVMCAGFGAFPLAVVARAHPWRWAACLTAAGFYALDLLVFFAIPRLTDALVVAEQQTYRFDRPRFADVSLLWPITLIIGALALDLAVRAARRRGWSAVATRRRLALAAAVGFTLVVLLDPWFTLGSFRNFVAHLELKGAMRLASYLASLALGALAGLVAGWLGAATGESLAGIER